MASAKQTTEKTDRSREAEGDPAAMQGTPTPAPADGIHRVRSALLSVYVIVAAAFYLPALWIQALPPALLLAPFVAAVIVYGRRPAGQPFVLAACIPLAGVVGNFSPGSRLPALPAIIAVCAAIVLYWRGREPESLRNERTGAAGPVALLFLLVLVSGLFSLWRYLNHAPIGTWLGFSAIVNVRDETAFEAVTGVGRAMLIALSGPVVYVLAGAVTPDDRWLGRWVRVLLVSTLFAFLFGAVQLLAFPGLGNDPLWAEWRRINATFPDPNALGTFVALLFPLALAMAVAASDRASRALGGAVAALSLVMLVGSGSRTGAAGGVLAVLLFPAILALRFAHEEEPFRRRVRFAALVAVIAFVAFVPYDFRGRDSRWTLVRRLAQTRELIAQHGLLAPIVRDRWPLWEPAVYLTRRYPVGGIGQGAFRYEVENTARLEGQTWRQLDNANNYYLQITSELGLAGLAIVLFALSAIAAGVVRVVRSPHPTGETRAIYAALATGWLGFLLLFFTGPHLIFEQVQATFWLFAGLFTWHGAGSLPCARCRRRWLGALGILAMAAVAIAQLAQGFGDLSLPKRQVALGFEQGNGLYPEEVDETGRRFRWTGARARLMVPTARNEIRLEIRASHPDLEDRPLVVWFTIGGKLSGRREIVSPGWLWVRLSVPTGVPDPADLVIHVERTWRPADFGAANDDRVLGVSIGRWENVDPSTPLPP